MMQEDQEPGAQQGQDGPEDQQVTGEPSTEELLEEATRERDQFRAMAQRAQADLVNYHRRVDEEREALARNASSQVIIRLLPILDDFHRAVEHLPQDAPASWSDGVQLILRKFQSLLDTEGVTPFSVEPGTSFDPAEHEAVFFEPTTELPPGVVVSTMSPGYRNESRVLRPAQVVLAKAQEEEEQGRA